MKHLKTYESGWRPDIRENKPKLNDWVICKSEDDRDQYLNHFLANNLGRITEIEPSGWDYEVHFSVMPEIIEDIYTNPMGFGKDEILYWSENKEELEYIIAANKYNL